MFEDDSPNIYIQKRMLQLLEQPLSITSLYERIPPTGIRKILAKLHIARPRYKLKQEMEVGQSKMIKVKRVERLKLPYDT
jgi:hypothetical protein